ncbi:MAG TPA: DMT family transporter [Anaerolineales bacterium]|nr:DMT family transporter [Anaerolineales bacterium]
MSYTAKGYLIAITGIILWSTTGVFIGYLITHYNMPPLLLAFWRNLFVCAALVPALFLLRRSLLKIHHSQIWFYLFYGLVLALFNSIWVLSVQANGAAVATVLAYSSAGFTAILALWLFKEKLGPPKITAVLLSLIGCVLVSQAYRADMWRLNPLGISTGLLSGALFAGYTLLGKEAARREINVWTSLLYSFAFGSLFILIFNLFPVLPGSAGSYANLFPALPVSGWLTLIFLSLVPTVLGFGLYNMSMNYLPASITNLLATTEPAMTALEAYIFLNERMTMIEIIGGLIILSAVFIVQFEKEESGPRSNHAAKRQPNRAQTSS